MSDKLMNDGIHQFLEKFRQAKNFNAKELRLTIQEAEQLSTGIGLVLSRHRILSDRVIELQEELLNPQEVVMSGGDFK